MTPSQVLVPARPFHSINMYTIFITNDVMEHEKCSSLLFFLNRERQVYVLTSLKDLIFNTRSITVQPKFLSLNGKLYVRDDRIPVFVNFSLSSGYDLHDRSQKC